MVLLALRQAAARAESSPSSQSIAPGHVNVIELDNQIISPVTQQYIEEGIRRSETDGANCLIIKLDTPGGLLESTRAIVKRIMNAKVPVVVYVAPAGSRAGSAGVFITLAAHVAAMAPSTNIGAAHPVTIGGGGGPVKKLIRRMKHATETGAKHPDRTNEEIVEEEERDPMSEKILNDTVAWVTSLAKAHGRNEEWARNAVTSSVSATDHEALQAHVIDLVAADLPDLLKQLDGRRVELVGEPVELHTARAAVQLLPMSRRQQFLAIITHPNIAYLLMLLGTLGLVFEFTHPGIGFPGIAGLICLLLALYAFQALPVSYAALALILLGLGLLVAEVKLLSHGLLAIGGVVALTLGSLMLFASPDPTIRVSLQVIIPTVATLSTIIVFIVQRALRAQAHPVTTGVQGLLGTIGTASTPLDPTGTVFIHGERWDAQSSHPVSKGAPVRVVRVEGLRLFVEPFESPPERARSSTASRLKRS